MKITEVEKNSIVELFKAYYKVSEISKRFFITPSRVLQVLKEKMGKDYNKYKQIRSLKLKLKI